jgi:tetratricopeptide (TPR) repeat protein
MIMCRVLAAVLVSIALFGCSGGPAEEQAPIIRTGSEFEQVVAECQGLSQEPLKRYDAGEQLGETELKNLRKAQVKFEGVIGYRPQNPGLHLGLGKIHQVFEEHEAAIRNFDEGASYIVDVKNDVDALTLSEFYYQAARSYEALNRYDAVLEMAAKALEIDPTNPNILAVRASGYIQTNQVIEAKLDLKKALAADPTHKRALQLKKFLELSEQPKKN